MGRSAQTEPPVSVEFLMSSFAVRQDGALIRAASARGDLIGEAASYRDPDGVARVRLSYRGRRRSMTAARVAWAVHHGAYPRGQVIATGAEGDFRRENLTVVSHGRHQPQSAAGRASSLIRRQERDRALLAALAAHEGASIAQLARIASTSESRISTHLVKMAERGLTISPMCVPGRAWALTAQGRDLAGTGRPLIDDLDRDFLGVLAQASMGTMKLSRRLGTCPLTIRRRARLLTEKGLVFADPRKFYAITPAGREALGPDAAKPSPRWVRPEAVAASTAKDVVNRTYVPELTAEQRSQCGKLARAAAKRNKSTPFNGGGYFERMAEAS